LLSLLFIQAELVEQGERRSGLGFFTAEWPWESCACAGVLAAFRRLASLLSLLALALGKGVLGATGTASSARLSRAGRSARSTLNVTHEAGSTNGGHV
jgi:hypothetical protein